MKERMEDHGEWEAEAERKQTGVTQAVSARDWGSTECQSLTHSRVSTAVLLLIVRNASVFYLN